MNRIVGSAIAFTVVLVGAACNQITGAGNLQVGDGGGTGQGGEGGKPPVVCDYPTENLGVKVGKVVPKKTWQGFAEGTATDVVTVALEDFYDCSGDKGVNAIILDTSATWCGACIEETNALRAKFKNTWKDLGIKVITLMIEDEASMPATTDTALAWKNQFNLDADFIVVADPNFSFAASAGGTTIGLPLAVVVDPRTMTVVSVEEGYPSDFAAIEALATKNMNGGM